MQDTFATGWYDLRRRPLPEAVRIICEQEPERLEEVVQGTGRLGGAGRRGSAARRVDGDVATFVAKTLEKDKARRYASAAALADDIRRYLRNEPVVARPASAAYQLRKFARRHVAGFAGVMVAAMGLGAGAAAAGWQGVVARQEARVAQEEARAARVTADFLVSLFELRDVSQRTGAPGVFRRVRDLHDAWEAPTSPASIESLTDLAVALDGAGAHDEAAHLFRRAQELEPAGGGDGATSSVVNAGPWRATLGSAASGGAGGAGLQCLPLPACAGVPIGGCRDPRTGDVMLTISHRTGEMGDVLRVSRDGVIRTAYRGPGLVDPRAIVADRLNGGFVICDASGRLLRLSDGGALSYLASIPTLQLAAVIQDARGDFIVAEGRPGALVRVSATGEVGNLPCDPVLEGPSAMAEDLSSGDLVIADVAAGSLLRRLATGGMTTVAADMVLHHPQALCQCNKTGDFAVVGRDAAGTPVVLRVTAAGRVEVRHAGPPLREPRQVLEDTERDQWLVIDAGARSLFRLARPAAADDSTEGETAAARG